MTLIVYDYENRPRSIEVIENLIDYICVQVISGDEIIDVYYEDGASESFDSGSHRVMDFLDYRYYLRGPDINDWADFKFSDNPYRTASYDRARYWCKRLKERKKEDNDE